MARPLLIVPPAALGEAELLRRLVAEVMAVCEESARFARRIQRDPGASAWARGRAVGLQGATGDLEGRIVDVWAAWDQVEPQSGHPLSVAMLEERIQGWVWERPEFPLPDDAEDVMLGLRLVMAVRQQRDDFVRLAMSANSEALLLLEGDGTAADPEFVEHMTRAKTWAMAADRLEAVLAQAYGRDTVEAHVRFVEEHGPWLSKLAFP